MKKIKLPKFFNYKEEDTDNGYETIQDFFLSWTFRCALEDYKDTNTMLNLYAKEVVFALLNGENNIKGEFKTTTNMNSEFKVIKINTLRQKGQVDLIAIIEIESDLKKSKYVLNIENKWYTPIGKGQLEKSKKYVETKYQNEHIEILHYVIFCDYEKLDDTAKRRCQENGYKYLTIEDLKYASSMNTKGETGNALFDEYWFNFSG